MGPFLGVAYRIYVIMHGRATGSVCFSYLFFQLNLQFNVDGGSFGAATNIVAAAAIPVDATGMLVQFPVALGHTESTTWYFQYTAATAAITPITSPTPT